MLKRTVLACIAAVVSCSIAAVADQSPTYRGPMSASEKSFVAAIQADLMHRFPTAKDAEAAGYMRYTNEDNTGAISYANLHWTSPDIRHPSQLWYDKNGNLLGADFSVPYSGGDKRPNLFGVNPGRWFEFDDHVHYVQKGADGQLQFDKWVEADRFRAAGGDPAHPTTATLIKLGRVKSASEVTTVFDMPGIWDLIVWVKPNPDGAFANKNPNVKP